MPDREELRAAYAVPDRARTRLRTNFVSSIDGAVTLHGRSGPLGGENDRAVMAVLRSMADVVLVGAGTTRVEGYGGLELEDADVRWRTEHGLPPMPRLAVVSARLDLDEGDPVFARAATPPLLITCASSPAARRDALAPVADVLVCGDAEVDLDRMLAVLAGRGWTQVLCEGGPRLFGSLLEADLVDEACVTVSPRLVGGGAPRMARGAAELDRAFDLAGCFSDDEGFVFLRYARRRRPAG